MKTKTKILTLLTLTSLPLKSFSAVNVQTGSFEKTFDLDIKRKYHSRSLYKGYFGFGWCSELETSLNTGQNGQFTIKECGEDVPAGTLTYKNASYTRTLSDGSKQVFSPEGRLTSLMTKEGKSRILAYDRQGRLAAITDTQGQIYIVKMDFTGQKIIALTANKQNEYRYVYFGDDLLEVKKGGQNLYQYDYDKLHNLTRIQYADKKVESIEYDSKQDLVTSTTGACKENYSYWRDSSPLNPKFYARAEKICPGQPPKTADYEFEYQTPKGSPHHYLSAVKVTLNKTKSTRLAFHPQTGLPHVVPPRRIANDE